MREYLEGENLIQSFLFLPRAFEETAEVCMMKRESGRLLPTLLGLRRGWCGCSLCCIRTMNYATYGALEYAAAFLSLSPFVFFSISCSLALFTGGQAGRQAGAFKLILHAIITRYARAHCIRQETRRRIVVYRVDPV